MGQFEKEIRDIEKEIEMAIGDDFETDCVADLGIVLAFRNHFVFEIDSENPRWVNIYVDVYNNFSPNGFFADGVKIAGGRINFLKQCLEYANQHDREYAPVHVRWFRVRPDMDNGPVYPHLGQIASAMSRVVSNHPEYFCI